ncbi:MAG: methyltransferase [Polyangiaceae bacterium]
MPEPVTTAVNEVSEVTTSRPDLAPSPRYRPLPKPSVIALDAKPYPNSPPAFAIRIVLFLRGLFRRLFNLVAPPELVLLEASMGVANTALLAAAARHRFADLLEGGPKSAAEIAGATGLDADAVFRTMRALAATGVFALGADSRFSNNRLSRAMRGGTLSRTREFLVYAGSGSNLGAWAAHEHALATGESPFDHVHGMNVWEWFEDHPDEQELFAHCMMGMTTLDAPVIASLYPFGEVKSVCDVGGGRGALLSELLIRHPHLRGVLADGAGVLASAEGLLTARGVRDRVELTVSSFFDEVPAGADAYLMKNILHDWDDPTCIRILEVVRAAMRPKTKLVLCELFLPVLTGEPLFAISDMQMMVACARGRERSQEELERLVVAAGFQVGRAFPSPTISMLEAIAP